jgi:hypothetical protein
MKEKAVVLENKAGQESREDLKAKLAAHVATKSETTRLVYRLMSYLTAISVAVPVATFIRALYLSINWRAADPTQITVAWFVYVASGTVPILFFGLPSAVLRAFPAMAVPGISVRFVSGGKAIASGLGLGLTAIAVAVFWGLLAYSVGTQNWALLEELVRILASVVAVGASIAVVQSLYRQLMRSL